MVLGCVRSSSLKFKVRVPGKMFPSSFRSYGPGRRKDSAIRTLVAETLVLAKTHGGVEKIESELEEELRRESKGQDSDPLSKWRRKGDQVLKSKYVLLTVALFCVTDCALVLGELILDLHKVKDTLESSERAIFDFKTTLHRKYPQHITAVDTDIREVFEMIARSKIEWHPDLNSTSTNASVPLPSPPPAVLSAAEGRTGSVVTSSSTTSGRVVAVRRRRSAGSSDQVETEYVIVQAPDLLKPAAGNQSGVSGRGSDGGKGQKEHQHSLEEEVAHALHLISLTLLAIIVFETVLKAFCAGLPFFKRRLETFDLFIVIVSFIVDIVFMQILPRFKIQDFVFILAFLLPWRVIRVVNSLVVAVQDHEHFRLKLLYSRKKKIQNSLRETEVKLQLFKAQCCALRRLCLKEGVEESKIEQIVQLDEYVVNRTGKSKCKIKIDNASVILLDRSDFPRMSPRPSLSSLLEKTRSIQDDIAKDVEKCDKFSRRNGHTLTVDDALDRDRKKDGKGKRKGRKSSFSFSGSLFGSSFAGRDLAVVQDSATVRRAGSQGQICDSIKRDLMAVDTGVRRAGSHSQLCHVTVTNDVGGVTHPMLQEGPVLGGSDRDVSDAGTFVCSKCSGRSDSDGKSVRGSDVAGHFPPEAGHGPSGIRGVSTVDKSTQVGDTVGGHLSDHGSLGTHDSLRNSSAAATHGNTSQDYESKCASDALHTLGLKPEGSRSSPAAIIPHVALVTSTDESRLSNSSLRVELQGCDHPKPRADFTQETTGIPGTTYSKKDGRTSEETVVDMGSLRPDTCVVAVAGVSSPPVSPSVIGATGRPQDKVSEASSEADEARDTNNGLLKKNVRSSGRETLTKVERSPPDEEETGPYQPLSALTNGICKPSGEPDTQEEVACAGVFSGMTSGRGSLGDLPETMTCTGATCDGELAEMSSQVLGDMNSAGLMSQKYVSKDGSFEGTTERESSDILPVNVTPSGDLFTSLLLREEGDTACAGGTEPADAGFRKGTSGAMDAMHQGQQSGRNGTTEAHDTAEAVTAVDKSDDTLTTQS